MYICLLHLSEKYSLMIEMMAAVHSGKFRYSARFDRNSDALLSDHLNHGVLLAAHAIVVALSCEESGGMTLPFAARAFNLCCKLAAYELDDAYAKSLGKPLN